MLKSRDSPRFPETSLPATAALPRLSAMWLAKDASFRGAVLMVASTLGFVIMHSSVRHVSQELPTMQVVFFRNLFGLLAISPLLIRSGFDFVHTSKLKLHALRSLMNLGAMSLFFGAVAVTPLATVTALSFTAPVFAAVMAVFFLGERFRLHRWTAIGLGFLGTMVILRPGINGIDTGMWMVLGSAVIWAGTMILIKLLSRTESSVAIVAWMNIFLCVFSLGPAIWVWQWPTAEAWGFLLFIGLLGSLAQLALSQAFKEADPTAILPFDFFKLVWASLLGMWLFAEFPDKFTLLGGAVIFASGVYVARREKAAALQANR